MMVSSNTQVNCNVDLSAELYGYSDEFRQVLINIVMNSLDALSSCQQKIIEIKGYVETESFVVTVSNNGPKIPLNMIQTIFEPFVSTKRLGTGIGLYLCRKIVSDHDGIIECTSDEEKTTFRIALPLKQVVTS